jgi:hypothetical protein
MFILTFIYSITSKSINVYVCKKIYRGANIYVGDSVALCSALLNRDALFNPLLHVCVSIYAMSLCMCVCEWWVVSSIARCLSLTVCVCLW